MRYKTSSLMLCVLSLAAMSAFADNSKVPANSGTSQADDVTMTVIPADHDVAKTVAHVINVPSGLSNKPGPAPAHGKPATPANAFGKQTAEAAQQIEENQEVPEAAQHEAENAASEAAQQAEQAAENQAQQAEQAQQQAQDQRNEHEHPNPPPPPPPPPPPGGGG